MESNLANTIYELELVFNGNAINNTSQLTFVNWLKQQYIQMESQLWNEIDFHLRENDDDDHDGVDLIEMIRISHSIFLSGNFRENSIDLNLFDAYDEILYDCIATINDSVRSAQKSYLNSHGSIENELKTMLVVQDHLELRKQLDDIYEFIASNVNYLNRVSFFIRSNNILIIPSK